MDVDGHVYRIRGSSILNHSAIIDGRDQIKELLFENRIIPAMMVTRRCFDAVGGIDEELRAIAEDRHFCIKVAKKFSLAYIAEPIVRYRLHLNQMHRHVDPRLAETAFLHVMDEVYGDPEIAPLFQHLKNAAYSRNYRRIADYGLYYGRDLKLAREYIAKSVKMYPRIMLGRDGLTIAYDYTTSLLPRRMYHMLRTVKDRLQNPVKRLRD
jgi:hypothetical protein